MGEVEEGLSVEVRREISRRIAIDGVNLNNDIVPYFELFAALLHAGYKLSGVNSWWRVLDVGRISEESDSANAAVRHWNHFLDTDLLYVLYSTTPLPYSLMMRFKVRDDFVYIYNPNQERSRMPSFTWIAYSQTHARKWHMQESSLRHVDETRIDLYPHAYESITASMFNSIDGIISVNPYAVIILQSDHGLHLSTTQAHLVEIGTPTETILELISSVFSAVRIHEAYGGLDAPLDPRNISRELVNRFVGENYVLLP